MNPHDKAYELVRSIRSSDAFTRAQQAKQSIEQDAATLKMVQDFKRRQFQLETRQMMGQTPSDEDMSQLQKLSDVIQLNSDARAYLQADMELQVLLMDVQRILADVTTEVSILSVAELYNEMGRTE